MLPSLLEYSAAQLTELLGALGHKPYRATQLREWIWKHRAASFEAMSNLPPALRAELASRFTLRPLELVELSQSSTGSGTRKFLSRLQDNHLVESVILPAAVGEGGSRSSRLTLCVSSQVGCAYGCRFCASGLHGFTRHLSAGEILGQILAAEEVAGERVDNLVFMGMGEPLANLDNLLPALDRILDPHSLGIGARHITISTSGNVPGLRRLAAYGKPLRLAVSLHGASDDVRSRVMPVNRKWPLGELLPALEEWARTQKHMLTLEYILIHEVNDMLPEADKLADIARRLNAKVNLIPYNTVQGLPWVRPSEEHCRRFCQALLSHRIPVTMRYEKGHDINAACGQLRLRRMEKEQGATPDQGAAPSRA
ncbi:MAG: 23S rRNA (adenine(2503)-C(2))-methyltransferase RlmN [Akkermansiaceae bacterium]|nr:23S rRNA (adenine(2503)-C(2))-methyltransferase RlmN [Akkermansiaceae bacterium]